MNRRFLCLAAGAIVVIPTAYFLFPRADAEDRINPDRKWRPTAAEIEAAVGKGPISGSKDPRMAQFCEQFKQRYRDHQRAVGMKFVSTSEIKAMFEPTISRWEMAEISAQADAETSRIFGRHFKISIYETYITQMLKLGVMKTDPQTGRLIVRFGPEYDNARRASAPIKKDISKRTVRYFSELFPMRTPEMNANPEHSGSVDQP